MPAFFCAACLWGLPCPIRPGVFPAPSRVCSPPPGLQINPVYTNKQSFLIQTALSPGQLLQAGLPGPDLIQAACPVPVSLRSEGQRALKIRGQRIPARDLRAGRPPGIVQLKLSGLSAAPATGSRQTLPPGLTGRSHGYRAFIIPGECRPRSRIPADTGEPAAAPGPETKSGQIVAGSQINLIPLGPGELYIRGPGRNLHPALFGGADNALELARDP